MVPGVRAELGTGASNATWSLSVGRSNTAVLEPETSGLDVSEALTAIRVDFLQPPSPGLDLNLQVATLEHSVL